MKNIKPAPDITDLQRQNSCFKIIGEDLTSNAVLICEHAGRKIPAGYNQLGLNPESFELHIAYDIGTEQVTKILSKELKIPAIIGIYSRLFVDLNRTSEDPTLMREISDGTLVSGNFNLTADEIEKRKRLFYYPFHAKASEMIKNSLSKKGKVAMINIHSFTPLMRTANQERPWHLGVLSGDDRTLADKFLKAASEDKNIIVGDNKPYSGKLTSMTLDHCKNDNRLNPLAIEIRQDLISDQSGQLKWGKKIADIIKDII